MIYAMSGALLERAPLREFERLFGATDLTRSDIVRAPATRLETMHALLARIRQSMTTANATGAIWADGWVVIVCA